MGVRKGEGVGVRKGEGVGVRKGEGWGMVWLLTVKFSVCATGGSSHQQFQNDTTTLHIPGNTTGCLCAASSPDSEHNVPASCKNCCPVAWRGSGEEGAV